MRIVYTWSKKYTHINGRTTTANDPTNIMVYFCDVWNMNGEINR